MECSRCPELRNHHQATTRVEADAPHNMGLFSPRAKSERLFAPADAKGGCEIVPKKTALVCIEYQNEFVTEGGKLHGAVKDVMEETKMLGKTVALAQTVRDSGAKVFHVPIAFKADASDKYAHASGIQPAPRATHPSLYQRHSL